MPRGGKRAGSGRKKGPATLTRSVDLTVEQYRLLKLWGAGNASAALRWLIDVAALLVRKGGDPPVATPPPTRPNLSPAPR